MIKGKTGLYSNAGQIANLVALHSRFPLAGDTHNCLLTADPALLEYLLSVLRENQSMPPARSVEEWQRFLSTLNCHSARPILTFHLLKQPADLQPPSHVFDWLRRELFRSAAGVMREDRVLSTLLERLHDRAIVPLLLKGAALSRTVYPDPALRLSSDIDMLVREDDLEPCYEVITGMGYRSPYDFHSFSRFTTPHQVFLPLPDTPMAKPLEIHWGIGQGFAQDQERLDGLFSRSISVPYSAFEFRTLSHVDHLAFCSHHAIYHHGDEVRLSWIYDLSCLSKMLTPTDWQVLPERAVAYRARKATEIGLLMAAAWTGTPKLPEQGFFECWPEPTKAELSDWDCVAYQGASKLQLMKMQLHFIPSFTGKAKYLLDSVFPPRDKIRFDCGEPDPPQHLRSLGSTYLHDWLWYWKHK